MSQEAANKAKKKIALAAVIVGIVLTVFTLRFIYTVRTQLWEQSVQTIMESTDQGRNTLRVQLLEDYESMGQIARNLNSYRSDQETELKEHVENYAQVENRMCLYVQDGRCFPDGSMEDSGVWAVLKELEDSGINGIINPHISSVTGVNVFDLYVKVQLGDNVLGYLVKEYEIDSIVDSFTLSFYNDTGFSYVVNTQGQVLIRPPHPNSNKTVNNLFDMLNNSQNRRESLEKFQQSLSDRKKGWAVFSYEGEDTVFCFTPLKLQTDWYLISIIPERVVNAQTREILVRALLLVGCIILGISFLVVFYVRYANRTNRKLRNQAEYIQHLYNAVPEAIALITVEPPYCFFQLNEEGLALLGYPAGTSNDLLKGCCLEDLVYEEDCQRIVQLFQNCTANGQKTIFESRLVKAGGTVIWVSGIVEKTLDENGRPVLIAAFHDITNEKLVKEEAEREKLQERVTLVGAVSNAYPVIISMNLTKDTLRFVYIRKNLMINLGDQKLYSELYASIADSIHPDNIEEFHERFSPDSLKESLGQEKKEVYFETRQMLKDGKYHWISIQIIYVDNPYSQDKLAILMSRRIDDQHYEQEQRRQALQSALDSARAASEAKSQFLSNMSHDIRTPMNAILGMTAIANTHMDDRDRVRECLKKISFSSQHLLSLINDVLDMSKIESGKLAIREEPFNLAQLVADSVELVRSQTGADRLDIQVHMENLKTEKVMGDALRMRQVCINILSNAVKYTPPGGCIQVELKEAPSSRKDYRRFIFQCSDTGIGMTEEFLANLFQPFERAKDSTTSKITGTGLGMAITKNLVDLMNGEIFVKSRLKEGSVFTVNLPLRIQEQDQEEMPREWIGVHCLLVDDDRLTCENVTELLEDMGLRTEFVTQGARAVEMAMEAKNQMDPYELIIVDWKMPEMDGVEVARRIRREIDKDIPVIVLTAYDWGEIESEAREAGVTAFLAKPFYRTKVCSLLRELGSDKETPELTALSGERLYGNKTVLVVEDNEINREIAAVLLEDMGLRAEEAVDGEMAVAMLQHSQPGYYDLVLMDIQMPGINGYETTRRIRNMDREDMKQIPIIAMTANAFEEDVQKAVHAGMNDHFAKPIDVKAFEELIHKYLS